MAKDKMMFDPKGQANLAKPHLNSNDGEQGIIGQEQKPIVSSRSSSSAQEQNLSSTSDEKKILLAQDGQPNQRFIFFFRNQKQGKGARLR